MIKRSLSATGSMAALLTSALQAPARASGRPLPLPLLPHLPFYPTTTVEAADRPEPLLSRPRALDVGYTHQGRRRTLDDFLTRSSTLGFLVLDGATIVDERYSSRHTAASRFNAWSVGKSITATAVGAAVADGHIRSVEDPVTEYVPELYGTAYDGVALRDVLQMSSGHRFDETAYTNPTKGATATTIRMVLGTPLTAQAREARRERPPGTRWNYDSMNTFVLGWTVAKATGGPLAAYVRDRIWRPAGMETPLLMGRDYAGNHIGYGCYHATVRDLARFGLLYLREGRAGDRQVIPAEWVREATRSSAPHLRPNALTPDRPDSPENAYGYGYQWWLGDGDRGDYTAIGILGQFVYVSPNDGVVIVKTSQDLNGETHMRETLQAFRAVATEVARQR